jgi:putative holliday junction resolvase
MKGNNQKSEIFPVLAIDYGDKRIGLAVSDGKGLVSSPLDTVEFTRNRGIREICQDIIEIGGQYRIKSFLIGKPQVFAETHNKIVAKIENFAERLEEESGLKIRFIDESYSSTEAKNVLLSFGQHGKKGRRSTDKMAAAIFLQKFLDNKDENNKSKQFKET